MKPFTNFATLSYSAPFTIQRVCELVVQPSQHYKYRDKYMRAMEKV